MNDIDFGSDVSAYKQDVLDVAIKDSKEGFTIPQMLKIMRSKGKQFSDWKVITALISLVYEGKILTGSVKKYNTTVQMFELKR